MARITKRIEQYIEDQVRAKVNAKYKDTNEKLEKQYKAEAVKKFEACKKLQEDMTKWVEAEAKKLGLVLTDDYIHSFEDLVKGVVLSRVEAPETGIGRNYHYYGGCFYENTTTKECKAILGKYKDYDAINQEVVDLKEKIILQMELGGKTLEDLNKLIDEIQ